MRPSINYICIYTCSQKCIGDLPPPPPLGAYVIKGPYRVMVCFQPKAGNGGVDRGIPHLSAELEKSPCCMSFP